MKTYRISVLLLLFFSSFLTAQKIPLDSKSYDGWKSLSSPVISHDGQWISYVINPQQGDGCLYIYNIKTGQKDSVSRGSDLVFSADTKYLAYQIIPAYSETRQAKKKKLKDDKMPKNDLEIRLLNENKFTRISRVKSFALSEKNSFWMAYLLEKKAVEKKSGKSPADSATVADIAAPKKIKKPEPKGTDFVIFNPILKKEFKYQDVTEYVVAKDGKSISFLQDISDTTKIENFKVNTFETKEEDSKVVFEGKGNVKKLSTDRIGNLVSFLYSADTAKVKNYDLWLSENTKAAIKITS